MDDRIERVMVGWDRIDEHRTGTPGDTRTARWLAKEIELLGADPEIENEAGTTARELLERLEPGR